MKPDKLVWTMGIATMLVAAFAAVPSLQQASAQSDQSDDSFDFDDTLTASDANATGMTFLAVFGSSMVQGTEVTGVVMNNEDEISVTLTNENKTGEAEAVTIVAFTGTMDTMSLLSSGSMGPFMNDSSFGNSSIAADDDDDNSGRDDDNEGGELDDSGMDSPSDFDDFATEDFGDDRTGLAHSGSMDLFQNIKTGSSVLEQGWNSPETVEVTLVDNGTATVSEDTDATFVFVMVLPFTEETTQEIEG